jgi:hypothetical protein
VVVIVDVNLNVISTMTELVAGTISELTREQAKRLSADFRPSERWGSGSRSAQCQRDTS